MDHPDPSMRLDEPERRGPFASIPANASMTALRRCILVAVVLVAFAFIGLWLGFIIWIPCALAATRTPPFWAFWLVGTALAVLLFVFGLVFEEDPRA